MGNTCSGSDNFNKNNSKGKQDLIKKSFQRAKQSECKVVILGNSAVGKTSIVLRYLENKFSEAQIVTLGATFQQPLVKMKNGENLKMNLWDTTGEEKFRSMLPLYYKNIKGAILTYDIGNKKSFESIGYWINELNEHIQGENIVLFLVGSKKDLPSEQREVSTETAASFAKENGMMFLEVSSKVGENINKLFLTLAEELSMRFKF